MIVKYTTKEKELLARLMRAEAVGEGDLGMLCLLYTSDAADD